MIGCADLVLGRCIVMQYFLSFLVLQPSLWGRESSLLYFYCLLDVMLLFYSSSSLRRGLFYL